MAIGCGLERGCPLLGSQVLNFYVSYILKLRCSLLEGAPLIRLLSDTSCPLFSRDEFGESKHKAKLVSLQEKVKHLEEASKTTNTDKGKLLQDLSAERGKQVATSDTASQCECLYCTQS